MELTRVPIMKWEFQQKYRKQCTALHVGINRHDNHFHLFRHLHAVWTCVCARISTQKKMTTICPPISQTQHFAKQPDRTYRLHSSDCCWGRFQEADFLRHAYAPPIETNNNPTLTFLSAALHNSTVHFTDWPRDGSTSPRFLYADIVL